MHRGTHRLGQILRDNERHPRILLNPLLFSILIRYPWPVDFWGYRALLHPADRGSLNNQRNVLFMRPILNAFITLDG